MERTEDDVELLDSRHEGTQLRVLTFLQSRRQLPCQTVSPRTVRCALACTRSVRRGTVQAGIIAPPSYPLNERVINVWNYLPYDIVCFNSLNAFKRSIVRVNFKSFLQCY